MMELEPVRMDPALAFLLVALLCYFAGTLRGYLIGRNDRRGKLVVWDEVRDFGPDEWDRAAEYFEDRSRRPFDWMRDCPPSFVKDPDVSLVAVPGPGPLLGKSLDEIEKLYEGSS